MSRLTVETISGGYGAVDVFREVSLSVSAGEIVTLAGTNGSGKSSVIKAIAGILPRCTGSIRLDETEILGRSAEDRLSMGIGYVPQVANVFATLTVAENLKVIEHGAKLRERMERVYATFPALASRRHNRAGSLSGGERQQLAMARVLMAEPALIILDEPTANLSPQLVGQVLAMVAGLADARTGVLLVEQRAREALAISARGYVMDAGEIAAEGLAADLAADPELVARFLGQHA